MNKLYLIIPLVLTLAFSGIYVKHQGEAADRARQALAAKTKAEADAAAQKAEAERQAKADADKREATRIAEEKKKEDDKRAKWDADTQRIAADTTTYTQTAAEHAATVKKLEAELTALRAAKDAATQANFDQAREVEQARIERRTAELETQRLVEMLARKNTTSSSLDFAL
jgi:hypothetical protein